MSIHPKPTVLAVAAFVACLAFPTTASAQDSSTSTAGFWGGDLETALDPKRPVPLRVRQIDEIGRWGGSQQVSDLREALRDESPDIRRATIRAMMRMGPDAATRDLAALLQQGLKKQLDANSGILKEYPELPGTLTGEAGLGSGSEEVPTFSGISTGDMAWAARALGQSKNITQVVPHLITALASPDAIVRQSALAGLQKATGFTMGASRDFLIPQTDQATRAKQVQSWQSWWEQNQRMTPEQWRISALGSEIPKDRAAAAIAISKANQTEAVPALIDSFRNEGNPLNLGATSAVREAMARALSELTGVRPEYNPVREPNQSIEDWLKQHEAAADRWKQHVDTVIQEGVWAFDALLSAPEAKTRANALRLLRKRPYGDQRPGRYLELMEKDASTQVQMEAYVTLARAVCVPFPFDPSAAPDVKKLHLARWHDWFSKYGSKREEGAASVFLSPVQMSWGTRPDIPADIRLQEKTAFYKALPGLRARTAEMIAIERLAVAEFLLCEVFDEQTLLLERAIGSPNQPLSADVSSMLQRNLARVFGTLRIPETAVRLVKRIDVYQMAARRPGLSVQVKAAAGDSEVAAACMLALGELGTDGLAGLPQAREMVRDAVEPSIRVRAMSAYTLARMDARESVGALLSALESDPSPIVKIAAAESAGILALKHSSLNRQVEDAVLMAAAQGNASDRLRARCREVAAILAKARE
jgi:HEAT repeat protein